MTSIDEPGEIPGYEVEALARVLADQAKDVQLLLRFLAENLSDAWPGAVEVKRSGMLGKGKVSSVDVHLGGDHFSIRIEHSRMQAVVAKVVGGIEISHSELEADEWIRRLAERLSGEAARSEAARAALFRLIS